MSLLKLHNIGKIYNSNDVLTIGIRNINLEFDLNEFVVIEGESGSGKSTLLNVIGANDTYEEGEMYFNGEETSHYGISEWEKYREENIATIFQDFNIIENLTVLENVELALLRFDDSKKRKKIAKDLIDKVGLTKQINQKGSKLSGGEKQRCVIARALAKDSPIILADEPTGNLDVKSSKDISKLLKDVSKDKLVIVVTHNPEYFKDYATRRVRVYDGSISENKEIVKTDKTILKREEIVNKRGHNIRNTFWIGFLNYRSRPKFTLMMSCAMIICAISLFIILSIFNDSLIKSYTENIDTVAVEGKMIVSKSSGLITSDELDEIAYQTKAGFVLLDREKSEFEIEISKKRGMLSKHTVTCLYAPYEYNPSDGNAVLVLSKSLSNDADYIKDFFLNANVGINNISVETKLDEKNTKLYLSASDIINNGKKIIAINSNMLLGEVDWTIYTFEKNNELENGTIFLKNSNLYDIEKYNAVFSIKNDKTFKIAGSESGNGNLIVQFSSDDYDSYFNDISNNSSQACLYFSNTDIAKNALNMLPDDYIGMLSTGTIYLDNSGDIFSMNIVYYSLLICISLLFAALISVIFGRTVKVFMSDFAVYKTLGISQKISSMSLYIQMLFIFLPTVILLPIISLVTTIWPGSIMSFISLGNYIFIEIMILIIVEFVAYRFNKSIIGKSIRTSLRRGSK